VALVPDPFDSARFDSAPFDSAPFDLAPFDFAPFDFALSTERFRAFGPDLANLWHEGGLHRVFDGTEVRIEASSAKTSNSLLLDRVRRYCGAGWDLHGFYALAASNPVLAPVVERLQGFRPPLVPDPFESLVTSISAQQISLVMAFRIRNRFIERFGRRIGVAWEFPRPEAVAAADPAELFLLGFTRRKAEYVVGVAQAQLPYDELAVLPDDEVKARLTAVRGLGAWSAEWYLARHLGRPEAWAPGDLGVRRALALHNLEPSDVDRFAPHQNLAVHYLLLAERMPG
jgi:3-methyladenine DNA glycosylase/8-oxoguanine DNA glycosylase